MLLFGAYFHEIMLFFHSSVNNWSIKKSMNYSTISSLNDNSQKEKICSKELLSLIRKLILLIGSHQRPQEVGYVGYVTLQKNLLHKILGKGLFTNYIHKRRGAGCPKMSLFCQRQGRKCQRRGEGGQKKPKYCQYSW